MAIITLTTDLGTKDFYLAAIKGTIHTELPGVDLIDISNHISRFNVAQAAFVLRNSFKFFPKKTVHVAGVDCSYEPRPRYLAVAWEGHYFVGPDNGLLSLMMNTEPVKIVEIENFEASAPFHFPLKDILVKAACYLAAGNTMDALGKQTANMKVKTSLYPVRDIDSLRGTVIYIDDYQNAVTNINHQLFEETGKGRRFQISFRKDEVLGRLDKNYNDVPEGEIVCLFGFSGFLEIAMNKSTAASLLGLKLDEVVQIDFF